MKLSSDQLEKMKSEREDEKKLLDSAEEELGEVRKKLKGSLDENAILKAEVDKGVEDIAKALGVGYGRCLTCVSAASFDSSGHSFKDYIRDFAT